MSIALGNQLQLQECFWGAFGSAANRPEWIASCVDSHPVSEELRFCRIYMKGKQDFRCRTTSRVSFARGVTTVGSYGQLETWCCAVHHGGCCLLRCRSRRSSARVLCLFRRKRAARVRRCAPRTKRFEPVIICVRPPCCRRPRSREIRRLNTSWRRSTAPDAAYLKTNCSHSNG